MDPRTQSIIGRAPRPGVTREKSRNIVATFRKPALRLAILTLLVAVAGCQITSSRLGPGGEDPVQPFGVTSFPQR